MSRIVDDLKSGIVFFKTNPDGADSGVVITAVDEGKVTFANIQDAEWEPWKQREITRTESLADFLSHVFEVQLKILKVATNITLSKMEKLKQPLPDGMTDRLRWYRSLINNWIDEVGLEGSFEERLPILKRIAYKFDPVTMCSECESEGCEVHYGQSVCCGANILRNADPSHMWTPNPQTSGICALCDEESERLFMPPLIQPTSWEDVEITDVGYRWGCPEQNYRIRGFHLVDGYLCLRATKDPVCWKCWFTLSSPCLRKFCVNVPKQISFSGWHDPVWVGDRTE